MAHLQVCDYCNKPTNKIAVKLFKTPANGRRAHHRYSHHADIGECCINKVNLINWSPRQKRDKPAQSAA